MNLNSFYKGFKKGLTLFGKNIANTVNFILLTFTYIVGIGIASIIAKVCGKHFMKMKTSDKAKSYWEESELKIKTLSHYYRQF